MEDIYFLTALFCIILLLVSAWLYRKLFKINEITENLKIQTEFLREIYNHITKEEREQKLKDIEKEIEERQ